MPAIVGIIVLPAHDARFVIAPSRLIGVLSCGHGLEKFKETSYAQERNRGEHKPRPGPVTYEVNDRADTGKTCSGGHDLSDDVVPQGSEHVGRRILPAGVP